MAGGGCYRTKRVLRTTIFLLKKKFNNRWGLVSYEALGSAADKAAKLWREVSSVRVVKELVLTAEVRSVYWLY